MVEQRQSPSTLAELPSDLDGALEAPEVDLLPHRHVLPGQKAAVVAHRCLVPRGTSTILCIGSAPMHKFARLTRLRGGVVRDTLQW